MGVVAEELLPRADHTPEEFERAVDSLSRRLGLSLGVSDSERRLLATFGEDLPCPRETAEERHWLHSRRAGGTAALTLTDGRWVVVRYRRGRTAEGCSCSLEPWAVPLLSARILSGATPH